MSVLFENLLLIWPLEEELSSIKKQNPMNVDEARQLRMQLHHSAVEPDFIAAVSCRQFDIGVMKLQPVSLANLLQAPLIAGNRIDCPSDHSLGQSDRDSFTVEDRLADVEGT